MNPHHAKGHIIVEQSNVQTDYICRLELYDDHLLIFRDEFGKPPQKIYEIPLEEIIQFEFINKDTQKSIARRSVKASILWVLEGIFSPILVYHKKDISPDKRSDLIALSFYHFDMEINLTMRMLELGENGIVAKYHKLCKKMGLLPLKKTDK